MRVFDAGQGDPAESLACFAEHRHRLAAAAEVHFAGSGGADPYHLIRRDAAGEELRRSGSAASPRRAARSAALILTEAVLPAEAARLVLGRAGLRRQRQQLARPGRWPPARGGGSGGRRLTEAHRLPASPRERS